VKRAYGQTHFHSSVSESVPNSWSFPPKVKCDKFDFGGSFLSF